MGGKSSPGNYFEDFSIGRVLRHPVPRTLTDGDAALYIALTGERRPLHCDAEFARRLGYRRETIDDLLVFHTVFGKSVGDVSLNAVANLGYADLRFLRPVYAGDTLRAESEVVGLRETSSGGTGIVYVHTRGFNQREQPVIEFYRWVMVNKREPQAQAGANQVPQLPSAVPVDRLPVPEGIDLTKFDLSATGGRFLFEDYAPGERIFHNDGMTIEEAEHALATRLYQNTARIHFNQHQAAAGRFGRRLMYGGHVISVARALSYNGLENGLHMLAWNGGAHANPVFAGDTTYAWTDVLETAPLPGGSGLGALRLRLVAVKNVDPTHDDVPLRVTDERTGREGYNPAVVLDLDYWLSMPRRDALA
ncbi:MAG TPA: MaoC family dehydratase [Dehalococcoidia bacterium]|jgi:2-methylfumaryl-CoA hydratase|nr:MaoC family dehydratase [Dehalococcoidia bacterium]